MSRVARARIAIWNERYGRGEETHDFKPHGLLSRAIAGMAPGRALDLGCGAGRHALALVEAGWRVDAVDGSSVGLGLLRAEAVRRGVLDSIDIRCADLCGDPPEFVPERDGYDLVCDFFFLWREQLDRVPGALRVGGLFVAAIHVGEDAPADARPRLLRPGELGRTVRGWGFEILHDQVAPAVGQQSHAHFTAELIARKLGSAALLPMQR